MDVHTSSVLCNNRFFSLFFGVWVTELLTLIILTLQLSRKLRESGRGLADWVISLPSTYMRWQAKALAMFEEMKSRRNWVAELVNLSSLHALLTSMPNMCIHTGERARERLVCGRWIFLAVHISCRNLKPFLFALNFYCWLVLGDDADVDEAIR